MKKIMSLFMAMLMVLSIVPLAFAEEVEDPVIQDIEIQSTGGAVVEVIEVVEAEPVTAAEPTEVIILEDESEDAEETRPVISPEIRESIINARAELKERIVDIREDAAIKIEGLKQAQADRISKLDDEELKKIALLDRARVKKFSSLEQTKLRTELAGFKIATVKQNLLFKKRVISENRIQKARENYERAEERYEEAKRAFEEEKALFEKYKEKNEEKAVEHAKRFLNHAGNLVIRLLEKIKYKAEENDDLTEDEASDIISDIDERIAAVEAAQEEVNAATTKEEVKEAGKVIIDEWKKVKARVREHVGILINAKVGEIIERSEHLEKKLNTILTEMEEKGIEVGAIDTKVDLFSLRVEEARNKHKTAQTLFEQIKEMKGKKQTKDRINTIRTLSGQAKSLSKEAHSALKEAHKILMTIVRDVKQAGGGDVSLETEEAEYVEVVEEIEEDETDEEEEEIEEDETEQEDEELEVEEEAEEEEEIEVEIEEEEDETDEEDEEETESTEESNEAAA